MGNQMSLTTLKTKVGQGGAVRRFFRCAPLPHHPTPKGVVGVVRQIGVAQSVFRGGADFDRFVTTTSLFLAFVGAVP